MNGTSPSWSGRRPAGKRMTVYAAIIVVTALLVLHVGAQMYLLTLGSEIQRVRRDRADIEAEIRSLELKIADLRKGSRIKRIARDNLGMDFPVGPPRKLF